jgi:hypothetical protein
MLQVARLAPPLLGESSGLVQDFLGRHQNPDGGFQDRAGRSDLYYTVFALDGLLALQAELPVASTVAFLGGYGLGDGLDFVHRCCLIRCWAALSQGHPRPWAQPPPAWGEAQARRLEPHRTPDGGFHPVPGQRRGSVYGCFLGLGAYQDLQVPVPEPGRLVSCLAGLTTRDGAWANEADLREGSTNATAAAVVVLRQLGQPVGPAAADWLLARGHPQGGFVAAPAVPCPDLLSTATALHALAVLQRPLGPVRERCLDFLDSLWTNAGAFHGHWGDEVVDAEYTWYGLLALGHLSG